jgi:hypothetical protein
MTAGVNVSSIGGARRGEMAADQSFEDAMAAKSDEGAVVGVRAMVFRIVRAEAVVEVGGVILSNIVSTKAVCVIL